MGLGYEMTVRLKKCAASNEDKSSAQNSKHESTTNWGPMKVSSSSIFFQSFFLQLLNFILFNLSCAVQICVPYIHIQFVFN